MHTGLQAGAQHSFHSIAVLCPWLQHGASWKWPLFSECAGAEAVYNKQYLTIMAYSLGKNPANVLGKCHHASGGQQTWSGVPVYFCIPHPGSQRAGLWENSYLSEITPTILKTSKLARFFREKAPWQDPCLFLLVLCGLKITTSNSLLFSCPLCAIA